MAKLPYLRVLIDDQPQSGPWNMAVDEALLETAINGDLATLRFYRWREPTASLGYFQNETEFREEKRFERLPVVRRLTGGGTLIHEHELTYSLTLPASQSLIQRPMELYDIIHAAFIEDGLLRKIPLTRRGSTTKKPTEPLLCFTREDEHDLTLHGWKVLGSAQRRRRGALLQHGGLIMRASALAPEIPGIFDLIPETCDDSWEPSLAKRIAERVCDHLELGSLSPQEIERTQVLANAVYSTLSRER